KAPAPIPATTAAAMKAPMATTAVIAATGPGVVAVAAKARAATDAPSKRSPAGLRHHGTTEEAMNAIAYLHDYRPVEPLDIEAHRLRIARDAMREADMHRPAFVRECCAYLMEHGTPHEQ